MNNFAVIDNFEDLNVVDLNETVGGRNKAAYTTGYYFGKAAQWGLLIAPYFILV